MAIEPRFPWLSAGGSHSELESASSLSLLHSIYGSQVSQVLLASDDSDTSLLAVRSDTRWAQDRPILYTHSGRPKSSPAATRLEREKRKRASLRPASAQHHPVPRARPATARARTPAAGRPRSALKSRSEVHRVPSSLCLEDVEGAEGALRTTVQATNPVNLTRVPEYVNFWQGKPLSQREHGNPTHSRALWKRPKSDYGSRLLARKTGDNALATVMEGEDGGLGSGGSTSDAWADSSKTGAAAKLQGSPGQHGLSRKNGSRSGGDGGSSGSSGRAGGGSGKDGRSAGGTASMWAQRAKRDGTRSTNSNQESTASTETGTNTSAGNDEDDFFSKKMSSNSSWLDVSGHGAKTTRFELPMDFKQLENMSPLQYLTAHCIISDHRMSACSRVFTRLDKDRDAHLCEQEVVLGLQEALHGCVSERQAKHLLTLAEFPHQTKADLRLFAALCCLAERVFSVHLLPALARKDMIECVDFEALEWKLRGCTISTTLHTLFTLL